MQYLKLNSFKSILISTGLVLSLASCSSMLPSAAPAPVIFDLGLPQTLPNKQNTSNFINESMVIIPEVHAIGTQNTLGIVYRYTNTQDHEPKQYNNARWSQYPAEILRFRMLQYLGEYYPVAVETGFISPNNWEVQFTLEEFSQNITSDTDSSGVVQIRVTLGQGSHFMGQKTFRAEVPAGAVNLQAGVDALSQATDSILVQITDWVRERIQSTSNH